MIFKHLSLRGDDEINSITKRDGLVQIEGDRPRIALIQATLSKVVLALLQQAECESVLLIHSADEFCQVVEILSCRQLLQYLYRHADHHAGIGQEHQMCSRLIFLHRLQHLKQLRPGEALARGCGQIGGRILFVIDKLRQGLHLLCREFHRRRGERQSDPPVRCHRLHRQDASFRVIGGTRKLLREHIAGICAHLELYFIPVIGHHSRFPIDCAIDRCDTDRVPLDGEGRLHRLVLLDIAEPQRHLCQVLVGIFHSLPVDIGVAGDIIALIRGDFHLGAAAVGNLLRPNGDRAVLPNLGRNHKALDGKGGVDPLVLPDVGQFHLIFGQRLIVVFCCFAVHRIACDVVPFRGPNLCGCAAIVIHPGAAQGDRAVLWPACCDGKGHHFEADIDRVILLNIGNGQLVRLSIV